MLFHSYIEAETVKKSWKGAEKYNKLVSLPYYGMLLFVVAVIKLSCNWASLTLKAHLKKDLMSVVRLYPCCFNNGPCATFRYSTQ